MCLSWIVLSRALFAYYYCSFVLHLNTDFLLFILIPSADFILGLLNFNTLSTICMTYQWVRLHGCMGVWSHEKPWNLEEIYKPACREPMSGVLTTSGIAQCSGPAFSDTTAVLTYGIPRGVDLTLWPLQLRWVQRAGEAKGRSLCVCSTSSEVYLGVQRAWLLRRSTKHG